MVLQTLQDQNLCQLDHFWFQSSKDVNLAESPDILDSSIHHLLMLTDND